MKKRQIHAINIFPTGTIQDDGEITKKLSPSEVIFKIDPKIKENQPEIYKDLLEFGKNMNIRLSPEPLYDFDALRDLRYKIFFLDLDDFIKIKEKEYETKPTEQDIIFFAIDWLQGEIEFYTQMIEIHKSDIIKENALKQYVSCIEKERESFEERNLNDNTRNGFVEDIRNNLLKKELNPNEINNACELLKWVLNFQKYCNDSGIYKEVDNYAEADFKKDIIRYFHPHIGAELNIESETSGGKVEITYKQIPLELKVEKKISERKKLVVKYKKQPTTYATGKNVQISVLCILDITQKGNPSALPENNIFLEEPDLHGFSGENPKYSSILIIAIIDGNSKKPSRYK